MHKMPKTWKTADGQRLKISEMETSHIQNCIRMLRRMGAISQSVVDAYLFTPGPQGEMAQYAFEQEQDIVFSSPVSPHLDAFETELTKRGEEVLRLEPERCGK